MDQQHHSAKQLSRSGHQMFFRGSHPSFSFPSAVTPGNYAAEARGFLARAAAGISMSAGLFMVRRSFVCYANHPNAPMLQECHLIGVPARSGQLQ